MYSKAVAGKSPGPLRRRLLGLSGKVAPQTQVFPFWGRFLCPHRTKKLEPPNMTWAKISTVVMESMTSEIFLSCHPHILSFSTFL